MSDKCPTCGSVDRSDHKLHDYGGYHGEAICCDPWHDSAPVSTEEVVKALRELHRAAQAVSIGMYMPVYLLDYLAEAERILAHYKEGK